MKNREKLKKKVRRALEIDEIIGGCDTFEMRGGGELTVRECRKILHYSETEIRLSLCGYSLIIKGNDLFCASYFGGAVRVDGDITCIELDKRESKI
jgi:hypothetical protein